MMPDQNLPHTPAADAPKAPPTIVSTKLTPMLTASPREIQAADRSSRLVLQQPAAGGARVQGGWWPRSRDTRAQLPDLVAGLNERLGVVLRLAVDVLAWDEIPRRITVAGHVVRVGWYSDMNHVIVVTLGQRVHLQLLVVPPQAAEQAALAALATSARPGDLGAQEILELYGIETEPITRLSARPIASAA
jgi:Family of unknown function (DUF5994)